MTDEQVEKVLGICESGILNSEVMAGFMNFDDSMPEEIPEIVRGVKSLMHDYVISYARDFRTSNDVLKAYCSGMYLSLRAIGYYIENFCEYVGENEE